MATADSVEHRYPRRPKKSSSPRVSAGGKSSSVARGLKKIPIPQDMRMPADIGIDAHPARSGVEREV